MTMLRTFIAVELHQRLKVRLQNAQDDLSNQVAPRSVRWVRPDGIHLTLKFLGDTPLDKVEAVKTALVQAAAEVQPFTVTLRGLGCFPDSRRPQVVWAGIDEPTHTLSRLRDAVERQVAPLGFPTEKRAFHPHLTLGRVQRDASRSEVAAVGAAVLGTAAGLIDEMAVTAVSYIRSDLRPSGAVYTTLCEVQL